MLEQKIGVNLVDVILTKERLLKSTSSKILHKRPHNEMVRSIQFKKGTSFDLFGRNFEINFVAQIAFMANTCFCGPDFGHKSCSKVLYYKHF